MDGLLLNTEDLYTIVTNAVLAELDRPPLPWHIKAKLQGRPAPQSITILHEWANLPIPPSEYISRTAALQRKIFPTCAPLPGTEDLLSTLTKSGIEVALATSSNMVNYQLKSSHLYQEIFRFFPPSQLIKGDDPRVAPGRGKPAPDIYLLALETINDRRRIEGKDEIRPEECLVFEDAVPGVESGRRAGMRVVWVPHQGLLQEYKGREEAVLAGLCGVYVEGKEDDGKGGRVGTIGDGWGELRDSLVGFGYERYGITVEGDVLKN